ncbi:MAG TPA: hypothetical protein VFQ25_16545, partial [Ktedonobacterales bacterium]|nr:hypothetical protein [Ktedonobacterales bacterium]
MSRAMTSPTSSDQQPMRAQPPATRPRWRWTRWLLVALLALAGLAAVGYSAVSVYLGNRFVEQTSKHAQVTPASLGLRYRDVTFPARTDGLVLRGWIIPGLLPNGQLTTDRTIILVHPHEGNRAEPDVGILDISA